MDFEVSFQPGVVSGGELTEDEYTARGKFTTHVELSRLVQHPDFQSWVQRPRPVPQSNRAWGGKAAWFLAGLLLCCAALCTFGIWLSHADHVQGESLTHPPEKVLPLSAKDKSFETWRVPTVVPPNSSCPVEGRHGGRDPPHLRAELAEAEQAAISALQRSGFLETQLARSHERAFLEKSSMNFHLKHLQAELAQLKHPLITHAPAAPTSPAEPQTAILAFTASSGQPRPSVLQTLPALGGLLLLGLARWAWLTMRARAKAARQVTELQTIVAELTEELDLTKEDYKNLEDVRIQNEDSSESLWRSKGELQNKVLSLERELKLKELMIGDGVVVKKQLEDRMEELEFQLHTAKEENKVLWREAAVQELTSATVAKKALEDRVGELTTDLADELAASQSQDGDGPDVVTPKAASKKSELDHTFKIKGLVENRVAELEGQLQSLQEHAWQATDVLKADKAALQASLKILESRLRELTQSRDAYTEAMEAAQADLLARLACADQESSRLEQEVASLRAMCADRERQTELLTLLNAEIKETLQTKEAEVELLTGQRAALEWQVRASAVSLLQVLKTLDGLDKVLSQNKSSDAAGELEAQVAENPLDVGPQLAMVLKNKVDKLLRLANLLSEAHYFHPVTEAVPVVGGITPEMERATVHLALYVTRRMATVSQLLADDSPRAAAAAAAASANGSSSARAAPLGPHWASSHPEGGNQAASASGAPPPEPGTPAPAAAGGAAAARNGWLAWAAKIERVERLLSGAPDAGPPGAGGAAPEASARVAVRLACAPNDGPLPSEPADASRLRSDLPEGTLPRPGPAEQLAEEGPTAEPVAGVQAASTGEVAAELAEGRRQVARLLVEAEGRLPAASQEAEAVLQELQGVDTELQTALRGLEFAKEEAAGRHARLAMLEGEVAYAKGIVDDMQLCVDNFTEEKQKIDACLAESECMGGAQLGEVEELTVRRAALEDSLRFGLEQLTTATAELGRLSEAAQEARSACQAGPSTATTSEDLQAKVTRVVEHVRALLTAPDHSRAAPAEPLAPLSGPASSPAGTTSPPAEAGRGRSLLACGAPPQAPAVAHSGGAGGGTSGRNGNGGSACGVLKRLPGDARSDVVQMSELPSGGGSEDGRRPATLGGDGAPAGSSADSAPAQRVCEGAGPAPAGGSLLKGPWELQQEDLIHENPAFGLPDAGQGFTGSPTRSCDLLTSSEPKSPVRTSLGLMQRTASSPHPLGNITNRSGSPLVRSGSPSDPLPAAGRSLPAELDIDLSLPCHLTISTRTNRSHLNTSSRWPALGRLSRPRLNGQLATAAKWLSGPGRAGGTVEGQGESAGQARGGEGASPNSPWTPGSDAPGSVSRMMESAWEGRGLGGAC